MQKNENISEVELFVSSNEIEIGQIIAILEENNIPFIRRDDGSGAYMNIYMGTSFQEKRIFVSKDDYDKALELISVFTSNINNDVDEETQQDEEEESEEKYKKVGRAFAIGWIGALVAIAVLIIVLSNMI